MLNNHLNFFRRNSLSSIQNWLRASIFQAGGDPNLIDEIIQFNVITDYQKLYNNVHNLPLAMQEDLCDVRLLLCLSGEDAALQYAKNVLNLNSTIVSKWGENALHYAVLSNSPQQIDLAINELSIAWDSESIGKLNILHFAILSKNMEQLSKVLTLEKEHGTTLSHTAKKNRNIVHFAASTGDPEMAEKVIELAKERGINLAAEDTHGFNALNYAIFSNNLRVINLFSQLGLIAKNQHEFSFGESDERQTYQLSS